jgi:hypothetical protein
VRVNVTPKVNVLATLGCSSDAACADLAGVLDSLRRDLSPAVRHALGDDPLQEAEIRTSGRVVTVELELEPARAATLLARLLER